MDPSLLPWSGLEPTSPEAMALCIAAGAVLVGLIAVGFALLRRTDRPTSQEVGGSDGAAPREIGILGLWRLNRTLHGGRTPDQRGHRPGVPGIPRHVRTGALVRKGPSTATGGTREGPTRQRPYAIHERPQREKEESIA